MLHKLLVLLLSLASAVCALQTSPKTRLLDAAQGLNYGVKASAEDQLRIESLVKELVLQRGNQNQRSNIAQAFRKGSKGNAKARELLSGRWELLYTSGPDVTNIGKIPGVYLDYVGQTVDVDNGLITNLVNIKGLLADVDQEVYVKARPVSSTKVELDFVGTKLSVKRLFGQSTLPLLGQVEARLRPLQATFDKDKLDAQLKKSGRPVPAFDVEYIDADLRVQRTGEGYIFVVRKLRPEGEGSGDAGAGAGLGPWLERRIGTAGMRALGVVSVLPYVFFIFNIVKH